MTPSAILNGLPSNETSLVNIIDQPISQIAVKTLGNLATSKIAKTENSLCPITAVQIALQTIAGNSGVITLPIVGSVILALQVAKSATLCILGLAGAAVIDSLSSILQGLQAFCVCLADGPGNQTAIFVSLSNELVSLLYHISCLLKALLLNPLVKVAVDGIAAVLVVSSGAITLFASMLCAALQIDPNVNDSVVQGILTTVVDVSKSLDSLENLMVKAVTFDGTLMTAISDGIDQSSAKFRNGVDSIFGKAIDEVLTADVGVAQVAAFNAVGSVPAFVRLTLAPVIGLLGSNGVLMIGALTGVCRSSQFIFVIFGEISTGQLSVNDVATILTMQIDNLANHLVCFCSVQCVCLAM